MQQGKYEYQSDFARKYVAQGREEGRKEGWKQGWKEGWPEGRLEGLREVQRGTLFEVLDARRLSVDESTRQEILTCADRFQLRVWLRKAATAQSPEEVFGPAPGNKPAARTPRKRARHINASKRRSKR